jgi:hypothetical protein
LFPDPIFPIVDVPLDQSFKDQLVDFPDDREILDNIDSGPSYEENLFHFDGAEDEDEPQEAPVARRKWRRRNVLIPLSKVKQKFKEAKAVRNL